MCSALVWPSIQAGSTCTCGLSKHTFTSICIYAECWAVTWCTAKYRHLIGFYLNMTVILYLWMSPWGCKTAALQRCDWAFVPDSMKWRTCKGTSNSSVRLEAWRNHWTAVWSWPQETTVQMNCACIRKVCMTMCRHVAGQEIDWSLTVAVYMASLPGLDKTSIYVSSLFPSYTLMLSLIVI